jgi:hypothetical protein
MDLLNKIFKTLENDMKAILKFNLPEDNTEFELATQASNMYSVLWDLDQWLRSNTKYAPDSMPEDEYKAYERCRETLRELMNNENISFEL